MSSALHRAALKYAEAGIPVHPLKPRSKAPATPHGFHDATTDLEQIDAWWTATPDANIGGVCGDALVVLDIDGPEGVAQLEQMIAEHGPLPATATATTGKGTHYYFKPNGTPINRHTGIEPGIDLLGAGGYVVLPPSIHPNGHKYEYTVHHERVTIPRWLENYTSTRAPEQPAPARDKPGITEGGRSTYLTREAGRLRRLGYDLDVLSPMLDAINLGNCVPPLPGAEVHKIAASVAKYEPGEGEPEPTPEPRIISLESVHDEDEPTPWCAERYFANTDRVLIASEAGTGKTTLVGDLAIATSSGTQFLGTIPIHGGPYRVAIVDEENPAKLIRANLRKLAYGRGMLEDEFRELPLAIYSGNGYRLDDERRRGYLIEHLAAFDPDIVILDAMVRFWTGDENSARDVATLHNDGVATLERELDTRVIELHHFNKPGMDRSADVSHRIRGSGDWLGAVSSCIALTKDQSGLRTLHHVKCRWDELLPDVDVPMVRRGKGIILTAENTGAGLRRQMDEELVSAARRGVLRQELAEAVGIDTNKNDAALRRFNRVLSDWKKTGHAVDTKDGKATRYTASQYADE